MEEKLRRIIRKFCNEKTSPQNGALECHICESPYVAHSIFVRMMLKGNGRAFATERTISEDEIPQINEVLENMFKTLNTH